MNFQIKEKWYASMDDMDGDNQVFGDEQAITYHKESHGIERYWIISLINLLFKDSEK